MVPTNQAQEKRGPGQVAKFLFVELSFKFLIETQLGNFSKG